MLVMKGINCCCSVGIYRTYERKQIRIKTYSIQKNAWFFCGLESSACLDEVKVELKLKDYLG